MPRTRVIEGTVRAIGHAGEGLVETELGPVYVAAVLQGERVRLALEGKAGGSTRGRLL